MKNHNGFLGSVKLVIVLWALFGWQGCLKKADVGDASGLQGYVSEGSDYLWPNATASVCWEKNITQADWDKFAPMRIKIAEHVTSQMSRAGFTLNGWQACDTNSSGMRVSQRKKLPEDTDSGSVKALGRRLDGIFGGVSLVMDDEPNFTLSAALHEFGHAVGLRHEANRLDSPCARDQTKGMSEEHMGALPQGAYDRDSIMNYCKIDLGAHIGLLVPLSQGDLATIKALYSGLPKFLREEACRKDGNLWVADNILSCCRLAPGKSGPQKAEYPICASNNASPQATTPPEKLPVPVKVVTDTRLSSEGSYRTVLKTPFQFTRWVLICNEGEYLPEKINALVGGLTEVVFKLNQAAGWQRDTFTCTHIDAYDLPANGKGVDATRKRARLTFPSPLVIKINQGPAKVDDSNLSWQFFDNVQAAPTISPVGGQTSQNPAPIATKRLQLIFYKFPKQVEMSATSLNCGSEKIAGQAVRTISQDVIIVTVFFTLPANLSCQGTELTVRVPKPNKDQNPKQTAAIMETKFLALKFNRTIDLKSQKDELEVVIPPTQCLSIFSTPASTPSVGFGETPKPAAPQPAATDPR